METSPSIYLVEDDPFYKDVVSKSLLKGQFNVRTFTSGSDYLKEIQLHQPDLAIIDYKLGDSDGLELLKKTKRINSAIKVVILSAQQKMDIITEAIKNGASYVQKDKTAFAKLRNIARKTAIDMEEKHERYLSKIYKVVFFVALALIAFTVLLLKYRFPNLFYDRGF